MKNTKNLALLALLVITTESHADGLSVGASIGSASVEADISVAGIDFDGSDLAWKAYGRYMFNDYWGLEVGYVDFGNPDDSFQALSAQVELNGFDAFVLGSLPLSDSFDLFGKAGVLQWDGEISVPGLGTADADGTDLALGFGGQFNASDRLSILSEVEWFDVSDAESVWMISVGFALGFN